MRKVIKYTLLIAILIGIFLVAGCGKSDSLDEGDVPFQDDDVDFNDIIDDASNDADSNGNDESGLDSGDAVAERPIASNPYPVEFFDDGCDSSVDHTDIKNLGVKDYRWIGNNLQVTAYVLMKCDEELNHADAEVDGKEIYLAYITKHCTECAPCYCAKKITFVIGNIRTSTYNVNLVGL